MPVVLGGLFEWAFATLQILRFLFGLRGNTLVFGVIASNATRDVNEIEEHLEMLMPQL